MRAELSGVLLLAAACFAVPVHDVVGAACTLDDHPCPTELFCVPVTDGGVGRVCSTTPEPPPRANTFYLSPTGRDADLGTSETTPWRTWTNALGQLQAGDTLIVLDGTWADVHGSCPAGTQGPSCLPGLPLPEIDCTLAASKCDGKPCVNGTPDQPITIRAKNERKAMLKSDGQLSALRVFGCHDWVIEGLRLEMTDRQQTTTSNSIVSINSSQHITLRKLLLATPNGWMTTSQGLAISNCSHVLVEDTELYWFVHYGFNVGGSTDVTLRRCYANSRERPAVFDGGGGTFPFRGDQAFYLANVSDSVVENCISENNGGFEMYRSGCALDAGSCANVRVLGSVSLSDLVWGFKTSSGATGNRAALSFDDAFIDDVAVSTIAGSGSGGDGFTMTSAVDALVRNGSVFGAGHDGVLISDGLSNSGTNAYCSTLADAGFTCSASVARSLFSDSASKGVYFTAMQPTVEDVVSVGGGSADTGDGGGITSVAPTGMGLDGGCLVYVPATSNLHGLSSDGGDIGANLIYRYVDGVLTTEKLWSDAGRFPCGAVIANVNDDRPDASSCNTVNERLNVGTANCPAP